jgi:predicted nucleic acid-binding protein
MGVVKLDVEAVPRGALLLVDSAPIIYLMEEVQPFVDRYRPLLEAHASGRVQFAISTLTLAEVMVGPLRKGHQAVAERHRKALESWRVVPLNADIAAMAARVRGAHGLRLPDAIQVATAIAARAYAVVSSDRDFSKVPGLRVIS